MDYLENLNDEQKIAVEAEDKHILVLAGAGSGKTRVIIARALHLIESGVRPSRILILSFTRKSAREIAERIKSETDAKEKNGLSGQTFHSWCFELIKSNPSIFKESSYSLLDEDDSSSVFRYTFPHDEKSPLPIKGGDIKDVYSYMVNTKKSLSDAIRMKMKRVYPDGEIDEYIKRYAVHYRNAIQRYILYKNEHKYLDYDDLLYVVSKTLKTNEKARDYITRRYDHILIDEMQDTNPLQYELLSSFYENCHIYAVGDDAQSIYAFRGADFKAIHSFTDRVAESKVYKLVKNYRSYSEILNISNWLLARSPLNYDKSLIAVKGEKGEKPKLVQTENGYEEASFIADNIIRSLSEKNYNYIDHMALSRTVMGLRKLESIFIERSIPYRLYGGSTLIESKHIRDVISPIRVCLNVRDEIAWMRFLTLFRGIGEKSAQKYIQAVKDCIYTDDAIKALKLSKAPKVITDTLSAINENRNSAINAVKASYKSLEERLAIIYQDEWIRRKEDFKILFSLAERANSIDSFISDFVLSPRLEETIRNDESTDDYVILSTIHSAKGLESTAVYCLDVSPYAFPTERAYADGSDEVEEERRCLYVALTRAKDELYIMRNSRSVRAYELEGGRCPYFLNDFDLNLVDVVNANVDDNIDPSFYTGGHSDFSILDDLDFT